MRTVYFLLGVLYTFPCGGMWLSMDWIHSSLCVCVYEHCTYTEWNKLIITAIWRHWDILGSPFLWNIQCRLVSLSVLFNCRYSMHVIEQETDIQTRVVVCMQIELESFSICIRPKNKTYKSRDKQDSEGYIYHCIFNVWFQMLYLYYMYSSWSCSQPNCHYLLNNCW